MCFVNFFWKATNQNNFDVPVCPADALARLQVDPASQVCKYKAVNSNTSKVPGNRT